MLMLTPEQLDALRRITSPTLSNAIERFNVRPRNRGFMDSSIRCLFPELGAMVGYAVTAACQAEMPAPQGRGPSRFAHWDHIASMPAPRVMVIQDLDQPPGVGAYWGEVQASVH
ncbi:MAG: RraA family protein, partial [Armatimonadetes bacterium]|nr:RraA family protein [Armatimonadota bacterium]